MSALKTPAVAAAPVTDAEAIGEYLSVYDGRDESHHRRLSAWRDALGDRPLAGIAPEDIEDAMAGFAAKPARVFSGRDADGLPIFRAKTGRRSGATLNRYLVAFGALFTWARKQRLVPRTAESPTRHVEKYAESRG